MTARSQAHPLRLGMLVPLLTLVACSGDANPVRDVAVATGIGTGPKPSPDFVVATRPGEVDYIRPGVATRATRAKTADEVKAMQTAMEQARAENESKASAARELGSRAGPQTAPRNP